MSLPVLSLDRVSQLYARRSVFGGLSSVAALSNVSLAIAPGEIHGLVGESGSGKSTLARIAAMLDRPSDGRVMLDGRDIATLDGRALRPMRRHVQMVFQDPYGSLDPRRSIEWIVAEPLHLLTPLPTREQRRNRVVDLMEKVGLSAADLGRRPHAFSGGQRQRIAIARALATKPRLLIADEATSALDVSVQNQILNLLLDLRDRERIAVLFVSHNLAVVRALSDRVSVLQEGAIVESGPVDTVLRTPAHPYTQQIVSLAF